MHRVTSNALSVDGRLFKHLFHLKAKPRRTAGSNQSTSSAAVVCNGTGAARESNLENGQEESLEDRIERLGRQRPASFPTIWSEVAFVFSIMMSQIMTEYFVSGFNVIIPTLITELHIPVHRASGLQVHSPWS